jgi:hypothetical protein
VRKAWTEEELKTLKKLFPVRYTAEVAAALGRTAGSVNGMAQKLKLQKDAAFKKMELAKQGERLRTCGANYRFKKGQTPMNKGVKMTPETYAKASATMFKKGIVPMNVKYDGYERVSKDGYLEVRVSMGKFKAKHRLIWEQHNGPVPAGMIVVFKDRNPMNATIENLELITRGENMLRNTVHRYPAELKETIRTLNKLKKTIYAKEQN